MADIVHTTPVSQIGARVSVETAGEALGVGLATYRNWSDGKQYIASCTASTSNYVYGVVISGGTTTNDPVIIHSQGALATGATDLTVGNPYYLGTAGHIKPVGDLATNDYVTLVGHASSATVITLFVSATGIQHE